MDVVVKENIANKPMYNYPPFVLGEVNAPDSHYTPVLYSHYQATKDFNKLDRDIYEQINKNKPADRKKTPKSVFIVLGGGVLFAVFKLAKHFITKK